jgi:transcriptional regulator with XRE-family HTH domain
MNHQRIPFGPMLRRWREQRRLTQTDLALAAESSTRHVSYLETGKSQPSRDMVGRLAEVLDIPLRSRNELLLAAGFAPAFGETSLEALDPARAAIDRVLAAHRPYPAFAVDRHWTVVASNSALPQLYEGAAETLMRRRLNAMRLMLHPDGMAPRILNYAQWRNYSLGVLRRQVEASGDPVLHALIREVAAYPVPAGQDPAADFDEAERLATPFRVMTRLGPVSFLNTLTVFGTAQDVTLSELTLEMLFPADQQTIDVVAAMVRELDPVPAA